MTIVAGELTQLALGIHRITAPNPGLMTGPGTNTYLLGLEQMVIVDPGPAEPSHIEAILSAINSLDACPQWIFVTHTHPDHSPAAAVLAEKLGIPVWGNSIEQDGFQDETFVADLNFENGMRISTPELSVMAVHTPGHVNNHYCFVVGLPDGARYLLTGDHIMEGSTVVIIPPAGDMKDYMESLSRLLEIPFDFILPAHGEVIEDGQAEIDMLLKHRLLREQKVLNALGGYRHADVDMLVGAVYQDVDPGLHPIAALSLEAHLIKLEKEGRALRNEEGRWLCLEIDEADTSR